MSRTLYIYDIEHFGTPGKVVNKITFGLELAKVLMHEYVTYRLPSGNQVLIDPDWEGMEACVANAMESVVGYEDLTDEEMELILVEGMRFLLTFIDHLEMNLMANEQVYIHPVPTGQYYVALLV